MISAYIPLHLKETILEQPFIGQAESIGHILYKVYSMYNKENIIASAILLIRCSNLA